MNNNIRLEKSEKHGVDVYVPSLSSWDGLNSISRFFCDHLGARIVECIEGPDARVIELSVHDHIVMLVHDDLMGNKFFPKSISGENVVREMAYLLDKALSKQT